MAMVAVAAFVLLLAFMDLAKRAETTATELPTLQMPQTRVQLFVADRREKWSWIAPHDVQDVEQLIGDQHDQQSPPGAPPSFVPPPPPVARAPPVSVEAAHPS